VLPLRYVVVTVPRVSRSSGWIRSPPATDAPGEVDTLEGWYRVYSNTRSSTTEAYADEPRITLREVYAYEPKITLREVWDLMFEQHGGTQCGPSPARVTIGPCWAYTYALWWSTGLAREGPVYASRRLTDAGLRTTLERQPISGAWTEA